MKTTNTSLLLSSQHLWSTVKRQEGVSRQVPSVKWSSLACRLNQRRPPCSRATSRQTAVPGRFHEPRAICSHHVLKSRYWGLYGSPQRGLQTVTLGNVWFCPVIEEWKNNPGPLISSHWPWTSHPRLSGRGFHAGKSGTNGHLSSHRGAHCTSLKLLLY